MDLYETLHRVGCPVVDFRVKPAPGAFDPIGVILHHTVSKPNATNPVPSLNIVRFGKSGGTPGPLCNLLLGRDAVWRVITDGRANDSGAGSSVVLAECQTGRFPRVDAAERGLTVSDTNGNRWFYDVEVENTGVGEPYPVAQLAELSRGVAAILAANGWDEWRVMHHRTWTRRKIDMSYRGDVWAEIAAHLHPHQPPPQGDPDVRAVPMEAQLGADGAATVQVIGVSDAQVVNVIVENPFPWDHDEMPRVEGRTPGDGGVLVAFTGGKPGLPFRFFTWVHG